MRGCASQVWLVTERQADGTLRFRGDSDAHIVRGLIAILLRLFSRRAPADILGFDAKAAFARLGLSGHLSAQRSNGLGAMADRIRRDAADRARDVHRRLAQDGSMRSGDVDAVDGQASAAALSGADRRRRVAA